MRKILCYFIFMTTIQSQAICFNEQFAVEETIQAENGESCTLEDHYAAEQKILNEANRKCGNSQNTWASLESPMIHECRVVDGKKLARAQGLFKCCASW